MISYMITYNLTSSDIPTPSPLWCQLEADGFDEACNFAVQIRDCFRPNTRGSVFRLHLASIEPIELVSPRRLAPPRLSSRGDKS
jgi:hypothetical protein